MPRLKLLPPGKIALGAKWFQDLVYRIEEIKPLDGRFITTKETGDGIIINASSVIELNVCKDGNPITITVVGTE
jgi:hypothetical protein